MPTPIVVRHADRRLAGIAGPGEPWAAAAERIGLAAAYALDLSGEVKEFSRDPMPLVALRPMVRGDLPLVTRWRQADHVREWFDPAEEPTLESVTARYGPRIDGDEPTTMWVGEANGRSVGLVQDYRVGDHEGLAQVAPVDPDAVGVDYLIGERAWTGRGIATRMLWVWLGTVVARYPSAPVAFAAPDHRNGASLRLLAKLGFEEGAWFDEPQRDGSVATLVACTLDLSRVVGRVVGGSTPR